jgi:tetratricopeptide (TPR) repeat protein
MRDQVSSSGAARGQGEVQRSLPITSGARERQRRSSLGDGRRLFHACLTLMTFLGIAALAQDRPSSRGEVVSALRRGDNQSALSLAEKALKNTPRDCSLLSLQGVAYMGLQQQQPALGAFRRALTFCPEYLPALEGAAQIEYQRDTSRAVPLLERILKLQPENPTANAMIATALRANGKCPEALSHYRSASTLFTRQPALQQGYGSCLAVTGDLKSALVHYVDLLNSKPSGVIRYDVALLQWKTHANDEALATLTPMLGGKPEGPVLALASKIHEERGETPQAVSLLREAILVAPDDIDNYLDFASIAFAHKSFQVGIDVLEAGIKRLPKAAALYVARGVLEVQLSKSEAAIADFEQAHRLDPQMSFAVDAIGIMHSQQHEESLSLGIFQEQARLHANDPLLQYLLAEQLSNSASGDQGENLRAAIAAAVRATTLDPNYKAAHDLLAVLYVRAQEPQLAIQQAELALAQDPNDQSALYQEMIALRNSGRKDQIQSLTARFNDARKSNAKRQQDTDRYRLQDELSQ